MKSNIHLHVMNRDTFGVFFQREDLRVMFADNRVYGCAGFDDSGAQISNRNEKKVK